jgi:hypothetical protein
VPYGPLLSVGKSLSAGKYWPIFSEVKSSLFKFRGILIDDAVAQHVCHMKNLFVDLIDRPQCPPPSHSSGALPFQLSLGSDDRASSISCQERASPSDSRHEKEAAA